MGRNRALVGLALAALLVALAAVPGGPSLATGPLVGAGVIVAIGTFAPVITGVRRLPLVGARPAELTVTFDPADPQCVQSRANHPQRDFQLRLQAKNTGTVALTNVRCRLQSRHDHIGRIRHDNTPPYAHSHTGTTLRPGASDYFDVAFCQLDLGHMVIQYADAYLIQEQLLNPIGKADGTPIDVAFEARREDDDEWLPVIARRFVVAPDGNAITLVEKDGS
jgi:hypothetical protein